MSFAGFCHGQFQAANLQALKEELEKDSHN
jgi:hypothetical protein